MGKNHIQGGTDHRGGSIGKLEWLLSPEGKFDYSVKVIIYD